MRRLFIAIAALLFFTCSPVTFAQQATAHITVLVSQGIELAGQGKLDEALAYFDKAVQSDPNAPAALYNRGIVYYKMQGMSGAMADFDGACAIGNNPACESAKQIKKIEGKKCAKVMSDLKTAVKYFEKGKRAEALAQADKAVNTLPDCPQAYYVRARINEETASGAALKDLEHIISMDFTYSDAYYLKGKILRAYKQTAKAKEALDLAVKYNERNFHARMERANLYNSTGRYDLAMKDFTAALEADEKSAGAAYGLALTYIARKDYKAALPYMERACKREKSYCKDYNDLKNNPKKSYTDMTAQELVKMAEKEIASSNYYTAYEYASEAVRKNSSFYDAQLLAGKIALNYVKYYQWAVSYLEAASALKPTEAEPKILLAQTYFDRGDHSLAIAMADNLATEFSDNWKVFELKAGLNGRLKNFNQAEIDYVKAASLAPVRREKGRLYFDLYTMYTNNNVNKDPEELADYLTWSCKFGYAQACKKN